MQRVLLDLCRLMIVVSPEDRSVNRILQLRQM